jgi:oligopeptide/dipeptide ABC transporter ATP-binding protein
VSEGAVVLEFDGVGRRFGSKVAVEDVSFRLVEGQTLGIVGESGSGKTTCVRMALGLDRPSSGRIRFRGDPYPRGRRAMRRVRRRIGFVFQDPYDSLDPRMRIGDIVAEPLRVNGSRGRGVRDRVAALLGEAGLPNASPDSYPSSYSGGGRQRIAIARGLVLDPDAMICDEPTASLDVSVQAQIVNLLLDLKARRGLALLFVSHDLDLVHRIADEVLVMYAGRVMERGPADQVYRRPRHPYTISLLRAIPADHPRRRMPADPEPAVDAEAVDRDGCVFAPRCPKVQDVCRTTRPPLEASPGGGSAAACFFPEPAGSGVTADWSRPSRPSDP